MMGWTTERWIALEGWHMRSPADHLHQSHFVARGSLNRRSTTTPGRHQPHGIGLVSVHSRRMAGPGSIIGQVARAKSVVSVNLTDVGPFRLILISVRSVVQLYPGPFPINELEIWRSGDCNRQITGLLDR